MTCFTLNVVLSAKMSPQKNAAIRTAKIPEYALGSLKSSLLFANLPDAERGSPRDLRQEFFYRGYIDLKTGDSQGAIGHFKLALQHLPPSSGIDLHEDCLANAYLDLGMNSEAIAEYKRILKVNANYPLAYYHLGLAYQRIHDRANAVMTFQRFLQASASADQDSPPVLQAKGYLRDGLS